MKFAIKWLNLTLFVASFALAATYARILGQDHPQLIMLVAYGLGVWPCAVIYVCKL